MGGGINRRVHIRPRPRVLWFLSKLGGPLKADVKATIKRFGGNIAIAGAGLVGCFLAIAATAFGGLYLVTSIMNR